MIYFALEEMPSNATTDYIYKSSQDITPKPLLPFLVLSLFSAQAVYLLVQKYLEYRVSLEQAKTVTLTLMYYRQTL